jgi:thiamine kinase-like enzyme
MDKNIELILLSFTSSKRVISIELIQKLWSGYGELLRVTTDNKSVIIKKIQFPTNQDHPRGWNSDISHNRKIKSYQVEINWYKNHNHNLLDAYSPRYITSGEQDDTKYLLLEDLAALGYVPKNSISWEEVKLCLKWLAVFHAKYLGVKPEGLWNIGTYWHLDTRPDELEAMDEKKFKSSAQKINKKLNDSKFMTIIHGDAKLENFLFSKTATSAVDFQYVGGGVGVKDLTYFLGSVYGSAELINNEEKCLDYYFKELSVALNSFHSSIDTKLVESDWRELYPFAAADFYRFLKGWSPDHQKLNSYSESIIKKVLECI